MPNDGLKVVISWSGESSKQVASSMRTFLKRVIQAADPWMSEKGITPGTFWQEELWAALKVARAGIICLTPENVGSPWMLFETGVIAKQAGETRAIPYLVGLQHRDLQGPYAALQGKVSTIEGTYEVLSSINTLLGDRTLSKEDFDASFAAHWPAFKATLEDTKPTATPGTSPRPRDQIQILDEVLGGVRALENRVPAFDYTTRIMEALGELLRRTAPVSGYGSAYSGGPSSGPATSGSYGALYSGLVGEPIQPITSGMSSSPVPRPSLRPQPPGTVDPPKP